MANLFVLTLEKNLVKFLLIFFISCIQQKLALAAVTDLDASFNNTGIVLESGSTTKVTITDIAVRGDGNIFASRIYDDGLNATQAFVTKYFSNGVRDTAFTSSIIGDTSKTTMNASLAVQTDGKILLLASSEGLNEFIVSRFNTDGVFDLTFGDELPGGISRTGTTLVFFLSAGLVNANLGHSIALQNDGKIVVAGTSNGDFAIARLNTDGTFDTTFSGDGKVTTNFPGSLTDQAFTVTVQADGKIIAAGFAANNEFGIARYLPNGNLDSTFSLDGRATFNVGNTQRATSLISQSGGKLIVVGHGKTSASSMANSDIVLFRINNDGTLDTTFHDEGDGDGIYELDLGGIEQMLGRNAAVQADGKIVVTGTTDFAGSNDFFALRFSPNGVPDTTFNLARYDLNNVSEDKATSIAIQKKDGRILIAGDSSDGLFNSAALIRTHAFVCRNANVTLLGTNGANTIVGTAAGDVIEALGGTDDIYGLGGNDRICAGTGDDTVSGGSGNDIIDGFIGNDILLGGSGNNTLLGNLGDDLLIGGENNDILQGLQGNDRLFGFGGNDSMDGGGDTDSCDGGTQTTSDTQINCESIANVP